MATFYGVRYKFPGCKNWDWDYNGDGTLVKYADINEAYQDYESPPKCYEWSVEEIPEDLLK